MEDKKLIAKKRDLEGSSNARRMRHAGNLPGVVYGGGEEPVSIEVNAHEFALILHHHTSESLLIEIELDGKDMSVLVKDIQRHPVSSDLVHVDLLRISADQPIHVDIELELVGEAEGVKAGGTMDQVMHSIGVECLPADLVESIEVDVSALEVGKNLHVSDLGIDTAKYKLLVDAEAIVCAISGPKAEESEDEEGEEAAPAAE